MWGRHYHSLLETMSAVPGAHLQAVFEEYNRGYEKVIETFRQYERDQAAQIAVCGHCTERLHLITAPMRSCEADIQLLRDAYLQHIKPLTDRIDLKMLEVNSIADRMGDCPTSRRQKQREDVGELLVQALHARAMPSLPTEGCADKN